MGDDHPLGGVTFDGLQYGLAILRRQVQAVLAQHALDIEIEGDVRLPEQDVDLGIADLELALLVEIDLVDGAAGGEYLDFHLRSPSFAADGFPGNLCGYELCNSCNNSGHTLSNIRGWPAAFG